MSLNYYLHHKTHCSTPDRLAIKSINQVDQELSNVNYYGGSDCCTNGIDTELDIEGERT
jgi:hypothetical protein